jgi:hypothetical protein
VQSHVVWLDGIKEGKGGGQGSMEHIVVPGVALWNVGFQWMRRLRYCARNKYELV